jgi:pilus assembly protein CpaD
LRAFLPLAVVLPLLALGGCVGSVVGGGDPPPLTPASRYTLQVETGIERIALAVHEAGVSPTQRAALTDLVDRFHAERAPALVVQAPGGEDAVSNRMAWEVKSALESLGVAPHLVQIAAYSAPDPRAPVLAGFETLRAVVPQCGARWDNLTRTSNNDVSSNFGCAVNANLAAQIANPRDIVQPRGMTPSDYNRRAVVFDNYRNGRPTAAAQEELIANRRVAQAVE